jgi:hypothetical protein
VNPEDMQVILTILLLSSEELNLRGLKTSRDNNWDSRSLGKVLRKYREGN